MTLPLYKNHAAPEKRAVQAHAGLWYDKFCNQWCRDPQKAWSLAAFEDRQNKQPINPKLEWIKTVLGQVGNRALLREHARRAAELATKLGGRVLSFATASRFVTGLGREHAVENGFAWHHALGVPYLPGSSVKGLVRAWVESGWSEQAIDPSTFHHIFGSDYRKGSVQYDAKRQIAAQSGSVVFFDALPTAPVQLEADVATPHYSDYYEGKRDRDGNLIPPADWLGPNPIPFLVVAAGQPFQFAVAPRGTEALTDCQEAADWLTRALECIGAGAKTAVGYGRFTALQSMAEKAAKLAGQATQSPARIAPSTPAVHPLLQRVRAVASERLPSERDQLIREIEASHDPEVQRACARDICERYPKKKWREAAGKPWRQVLQKLAT